MEKSIREITGVSGFAVKGTIPTFSVLTGTCVTVGNKLIGTGTLFTTELVGKNFHYSDVQNATRRIFAVYDDALAILENAYASDIASETMKSTQPLDVSVACINLSTTITSKFIERDLLPGAIRNTGTGIQDPISYDANGGSLEFLTRRTSN